MSSPKSFYPELDQGFGSFAPPNTQTPQPTHNFEHVYRNIISEDSLDPTNKEEISLDLEYMLLNKAREHEWVYVYVLSDMIGVWNSKKPDYFTNRLVGTAKTMKQKLEDEGYTDKGCKAYMNDQIQKAQAVNAPTTKMAWGQNSPFSKNDLKAQRTLQESQLLAAKQTELKKELEKVNSKKQSLENQLN